MATFYKTRVSSYIIFMDYYLNQLNYNDWLKRNLYFGLHYAWREKNEYDNFSRYIYIYICFFL